jgi:hypothetical protein
VSRRVSRFCDRCSQNILEGGAVLDVRAGDLRQRHPELIDLCPTCGDRFDEFLRSGHQVSHEAASVLVLGCAVPQTLPA